MNTLKIGDIIKVYTPGSIYSGFNKAKDPRNLPYPLEITIAKIKDIKNSATWGDHLHIGFYYDRKYYGFSGREIAYELIKKTFKYEIY